MGRKRKANPIESSSAKKTARDKKKAETTGVKKMRQNRAAARKAAAEAEDVEDEEANPDGDGEEETGVGGEVETGVGGSGVAKEASFDEVESGDEFTEEESGDEVEEDKPEEDQAVAASSSKGKRVKKEGKANKNRMEVVIKYCKHSGPLFEARAEELKAALESSPGFNVTISNKINARKKNNAGARKDIMRLRAHSTMAALILTLIFLPSVAARTGPMQIRSNNVKMTEDALIAANTDLIKAGVEKIRAETDKIRAETEDIENVKPWFTQQEAESAFMLVGFVAFISGCVWMCSWLWLIADWYCSKPKCGNLKTQREL